MLMNRLNEKLYQTEHTDIDHILAKYFKKHADTIAGKTIEEIAAECYVSKGKISKFRRSLGYESFIAFKDDCLNEARIKSKVVNQAAENLEKDFQNHLDLSLTTIHDNLSHMEIARIEMLARAIHEVKTVYLYGVAYANLICKFIQYELDFLDKDVMVMDESLSKDYEIEPESLLIVVSVNGADLEKYNRQLHQLLRYPMQKWILITGTTSSQLLESFHSALVIPAKNADLRDQRILIRYTIDILLGRYQYLFSNESDNKEF